jgi:hypothetical protein
MHFNYLGLRMDMNTYIGNVALGWLVASLALVLEHMWFWVQPWRLAEPWNYATGVLTILAGTAVWAWQQAQLGAIDPWLALIAFGIIAVGSGFWVVLAYGLRGKLALRKAHAEQIKDRKIAIAGALDDTLDDLRRN